MYRFALVLFSLAAMTTGDIALAQDVDPTTGREVRYRERTEIDFDDVDVEGQMVRPQGDLVRERQRASFNPLIRLREHFNDEMRASIDEVK